MGLQYRGDVLEATTSLKLGGVDAIRGMKNAIINGAMRIAQRGTSHSNPADEYTLDRWVVDEGGASSSTLSQEAFTLGQSDVPGEPEFFMQLIKNGTGGANATIGQRVEGVRTLAGQTCVLSFWARVTSGTLSLTPKLIQKFGSGGSVDNTETGSAKTVTTTWQKFEYTVTLDSMSGKTIGAGDHLEVRLEMDSATAYTLQVYGVQLEPGNVATAFEARLIGLEQMLCERYYERFTAPGSNCWFPASGGGLNATQSWVTFAPMVAKRAVPTVAVSDINDFKLTSITSLTEFSITSVGISANATERGFALSLNGTGLPDNDIVALRLDAVDAWIEFDAEL